ncbi:MAG TPA: alanine--tRNA ligase [Anaerolineales bacterium]|nr:alanine--tRNA ligase [Anaerolineales bacterium]
MKPTTGAQIRQSYIDFFVEHGHTAVPSSSLVPGGDATLLFTNSGMVQFKDVFLGTDRRPYTRAVDSQKCLRVAGKHNDLDEVGRDDTHHTFFEMLGNWSFGDYYKKEAITWAWQLLTDVWGLDKKRIWATCFEGEKSIPSDEEAAAHWREQPGFKAENVLYFGRKDNFWEMADTGPCGPCSEIHYDRGSKYCDRREIPDHVCKVNGDCTRFLELWNLVFMQYNRLGPDLLEPLPARHVDTGMGFERIVSVLQDVDSNYKTDLFARSLTELRALTGQSESAMLQNFTPYRVIADHARSAAFLIADGVVPGNIGRNYVCRMIIRRAARFGTKIGLREPFLARIAETVIETYGSFYSELKQNRVAILENLTREELRFARTIESGTAQLQNLLESLGREGGRVLDGARAFDLYATYGLPLEISRDIAHESNLEVDETGFRESMEAHRLASGGGKAMGKLGGEDSEFYGSIARELQLKGRLDAQGVVYDPYTSSRAEGEVLALVINGEVARQASFGDSVEIILPRTGFYVESGGQVSDEGLIRSLATSAGGDPVWQVEVREMRRPAAGLIVHVGEVMAGQPKVGDQAVAEVDLPRRHDIMRNHTATHLLHAALHTVLGAHARQAGSLVAPDRLRFDFNHPEAMTEIELRRVERLVNDAIAADLAVIPKLKSRSDAIAEGAMALFGEKYGETVRTVSIFSPQPAGQLLGSIDAASSTGTQGEEARYSYELCGGTHLERTSDVGVFVVTSEASAAAGVRRIEAVTGRAAYTLMRRRFDMLDGLASTLRTSSDDVPLKVDALQTEIAALRRQLAELRKEQALAILETELAKVDERGDVKVLALELPQADVDTLRALSDRFRERYPSNGAAILASGVVLISVVTDDLVKRGLRAADLITAIGGRGGGRPNLAQGSLPDASQLSEALSKLAAAVKAMLG